MMFASPKKRSPSSSRMTHARPNTLPVARKRVAKAGARHPKPDPSKADREPTTHSAWTFMVLEEHVSIVFYGDDVVLALHTPHPSQPLPPSGPLIGGANHPYVTLRPLLSQA